MEKKRSNTSMKRLTQVTAGLLSVLLAGMLISGTAGCDQELAGELATLTGAYVGDVVAVSTTEYLLDALGVEHEDGTHEHEDGHSHDTEPLHEHEH
jgi:hypothetical protein